MGAAAGTEGLYNIWSSAHYILVDVMERFREKMEGICSAFASAEFHVNAVGSIEKIVDYSFDPLRPHCVTFQSQTPEGWIKTQVTQRTLDELAFGTFLGSTFATAIVKIDVDGPEIDVLNGAKKLMEKDCIFIIETPLMDSKLSRFTTIANYMRAHEYEIYDLIEPVYRPSDNSLWQVDSVFVRKDSYLRISNSY